MSGQVIKQFFFSFSFFGSNCLMVHYLVEIYISDIEKKLTVENKDHYCWSLKQQQQQLTLKADKKKFL